jgi:hypothetical protein
MTQPRKGRRELSRSLGGQFKNECKKATVPRSVLVFEPPAYAADKALGRSNTIGKSTIGKRLDELAEDMHTRPERLTHLMAKAEMELRRTSAQRRATTYMFVASIAAAVSAAAAAITAGIAAYVAFHGG